MRASAWFILKSTEILALLSKKKAEKSSKYSPIINPAHFFKQISQPHLGPGIQRGGAAEKQEDWYDLVQQKVKQSAFQTEDGCNLNPFFQFKVHFLRKAPFFDRSIKP